MQGIKKFRDKNSAPEHPQCFLSPPGTSCHAPFRDLFALIISYRRSDFPQHLLIDALELGADDYVPKPFDMNELLARVRALARRRGTKLTQSQRFQDVTLLADSRELEKDGSRIKLSDKEYAIMELLIRQGGHYVDKEYMTARVWNGDNSASYNSAEVYISFLRKKLKALGSQVSIKASRNVGYKLDG